MQLGDVIDREITGCAVLAGIGATLQRRGSLRWSESTVGFRDDGAEVGAVSIGFLEAVEGEAVNGDHVALIVGPSRSALQAIEAQAVRQLGGRVVPASGSKCCFSEISSTFTS